MTETIASPRRSRSWLGGLPLVIAATQEQLGLSRRELRVHYRADLRVEACAATQVEPDLSREEPMFVPVVEHLDEAVSFPKHVGKVD